MKTIKKNFNVFICYRGKEDGDGRAGSDGKPIALDIYSELNKYSDINAFFAPKEYEAHHDFVDDIPKILKSVKVAILVLTAGFFQPFSSPDDVVKQELDSLLEKNIPIIPVFDKGYNILNDDAVINKYYNNEQKNKITHIVGVAYNGIYDFRGDKLYSSIRKIMDCSINGIDATSYNFDSILFQIGFIEDSSSVTVALSKIIDFLEDKLLHTADIDMKQLFADTDECIDKICKKIPHFSALKAIWQDNLRKILKKPQDAAREALHNFKRKKRDTMDKITVQAKSIIKEGDGILTFSQSQSVIDLLLSINIPIKSRQSSTIYISEGRSKCNKPFIDAIEIYKKLENADYKQKIIITDCSVYQLMVDKKITKVILGACSVKLKNGKLENFVNSAGTYSILMFAEKFNIPVYIISESTKFLSSFENRELQLSIQEFKKEFGENIDAIDYVELSRTPNVSFISENGNDIESLAAYFWDDLNKDRRVISIDDGYFVKSCDKTEYGIECTIYNGLQDQQSIFVSRVKDCDDKRRTFKLDCVNGIRIFELFVILDNLSKYDLGQAAQTKKRVLERCMKNQIQIWDLLKKNCAEWGDILPYPSEKIVDLLTNLLNSIYIFYPYVNLDIDVDQLKEEANKLYSQFCRYAKVPFRDSTIKNMAIDIPELYGLDNIVNDERESILREAIRNLVYADNFDNFDGCKIFDFDFSSCKNLTSQYDDYIGLKMHERTYNYETELEVLAQYKDNEEFFFALFVRYLRFAGRKRMYRLLNSSFHRIRFRYDDETFYFKKLIYLAKYIYPNFPTTYPNIYKLITQLSILPNLQVKYDAITHLYDIKTVPWLGMCKNNIKV